MNRSEGQRLLDECYSNYVLVARRGNQIELSPVFPEEHPLTADLIAQVRASKAELLELLAFEEEADALLLASTRRLAAKWPAGCPLDDEGWDICQGLVEVEYRDRNLPGLKDALRTMEHYALATFRAFKKEATNDHAN